MAIEILIFYVFLAPSIAVCARNLQREQEVNETSHLWANRCINIAQWLAYSKKRLSHSAFYFCFSFAKYLPILVDGKKKIRFVLGLCADNDFNEKVVMFCKLNVSGVNTCTIFQNVTVGSVETL